jgi:hypothetical protein
MICQQCGNEGRPRSDLCKKCYNENYRQTKRKNKIIYNNTMKCNECGCQVSRRRHLCEKCYQSKYKKINHKQILEYHKINNKKRYILNKNELIKQTGLYARKNYIQTRFYRLRHNAKRRNIDFNIQKEDFIEYIKQCGNICNYCGVKTELSKHMNNTKQLSIDRKDNNKGYSIDNIAVCCSLCNKIKNDIFTVDDMKTIGPIIKKRRKDGN